MDYQQLNLCKQNTYLELLSNDIIQYELMPRIWQYVTIRKYDKYHLYSIICPVCSDKSEDNTQISDYTTQMMNWCEECGTYTLLDCIVNLCELYKCKCSRSYKKCICSWRKIKEYKYTSYNFDNAIIFNKKKFMVPSLYVLKLLNRDIIMNYYCDMKINDNNEVLHDFDDKFQSVETDEELIELFKYGAVVNSHDPNTINDKYDLSHDGIYIYLLCKNINGQLVKAKYWGD